MSTLATYQRFDICDLLPNNMRMPEMGHSVQIFGLSSGNDWKLAINSLLRATILQPFKLRIVSIIV